MRVKWEDSRPGVFFGPWKNGEFIVVFISNKRKWRISKFGTVVGKAFGETMLPQEFNKLDDALQFAKEEYQKLK